MIPWRLFWLFHEQMDRVYALERLNSAQAMAHGLGMIFGGEGSAKTARRVYLEAFPHLEGFIDG